MATRSTLFAALFAAGTFGCADRDLRVRSGPPLPFLVDLRLHVTEQGEAGADAGIGAPSEYSGALAERLESLFESSRTFVDIAARGENADLELDIEIVGSSFGPHAAIGPIATWSTIAWIFGGHLSWLIDDVEYTQSDYYLRVKARVPRSRTEIDLAHRPLKGLQLDLTERLSGGQWIWAILVPPYVLPGDRATVRQSLLERSIDRFALEELEQLAESLPARFLTAYGSYLVHDPDADSVHILARESLRSVEIDGVTFDSLDLENRYRVADPIPLFKRLADLGIGQIQRDSALRFYSVPIAGQPRGRIAVRTYLESAREPASWTIRR